MKQLLLWVLSTPVLAASLVAPKAVPVSFYSGSGCHLKTPPPSTRITVALSKTSDNNGLAPRAKDGNNEELALPREVMPITLGVLAQMLGEGIAFASLPLYLTRLGAAPQIVGLAISCFSVAQMTFAPILVELSSRIGRFFVLRICLTGAAASSLLIAFSGSIVGVILGRTLAGAFAACVPVAQSAVTDILNENQTAIGLSRVSAAAQLGVVVGPAASAIFQETFVAIGFPAARCLPAVFTMSSLFALSILAQMAMVEQQSARAFPVNEKTSVQEKTQLLEDKGRHSEGRTNLVRVAQPMLCMITIIMGWTAVLSNSIYGLFAPRFMGFQQPQLSATYSAAAIMMVATQVLFPRLVAKIGAHSTCTLGILAAGSGVGGLSLARFQPFHSTLYMINRVGAGIADTSTATLVASTSGTKEARSRNLALLTSTRAAARIITPVVSSKLFELSCKWTQFPGALPYITASCFALAVGPFPTLLRKAEKKHSKFWTLYFEVYTKIKPVISDAAAVAWEILPRWNRVAR